MKLLACSTFLFALFSTAVYANTEKVIFLAPAAQAIPEAFPPLRSLGLDILTPDQPSVRTSLPAAFPTNEKRHAREYWLLLRNLKAGQRHEVRICWSATQPTEFWLDVFNITEILENPHLLQNLVDSNSQRPDSSKSTLPDAKTESILGLRIRLAADFFTSNRALMLHPPPVDVDIILDPYIANIFPSSLLPTAVYLSILTVGGWYISGFVWSFLQPAEKVHKE